MSLIDEVGEKYVEPGHPTAFSAPGNIIKHFNGEGKKYKKEDVVETLQTLPAYTLHREFHRHKTNPVFVYSRREQIQADLIDVSDLKPENDGITFLLVLIDVFTKKLFVRSLKQKTAIQTKNAIQSIVELIDKPIKAILFDRGKEFKNKIVENYLKSVNIKFSYPSSEKKCAVVERANRSLQDLIYRYLEHNQTYRYIDKLEALVETYNSRIHRTIKMSPNDAELDNNQNLVFNAHNERFSKIVEDRKGKKPKYAIGAKVLIKNLQTRFTRGYKRRFNTEQYEIVRVNSKLPLEMYTLKSLNDGEVVLGQFYSYELQPISGDIHRIIVLKRKTIRGKAMLYVRYEGFDETHDKWINAADDVVHDLSQ